MAEDSEAAETEQKECPRFHADPISPAITSSPLTWTPSPRRAAGPRTMPDGAWTEDDEAELIKQQLAAWQTEHERNGTVRLGDDGLLLKLRPWLETTESEIPGEKDRVYRSDLKAQMGAQVTSINELLRKQVSPSSTEVVFQEVRQQLDLLSSLAKEYWVNAAVNCVAYGSSRSRRAAKLEVSWEPIEGGGNGLYWEAVQTDDTEATQQRRPNKRHTRFRLGAVVCAFSRIFVPLLAVPILLVLLSVQDQFEQTTPGRGETDTVKIANNTLVIVLALILLGFQAGVSVSDGIERNQRQLHLLQDEFLRRQTHILNAHFRYKCIAQHWPELKQSLDQFDAAVDREEQRRSQSVLPESTPPTPPKQADHTLLQPPTIPQGHAPHQFDAYALQEATTKDDSSVSLPSLVNRAV